MRQWGTWLIAVAIVAGAAGQPVAGTWQQGRPGVAAPDQIGGDGFEPVSSLPPAGQEQLPAAPLVMAAYGFVWVMLAAYVWFVWRRLGAVERELRAVAERIEQRQGR